MWEELGPLCRAALKCVNDPDCQYVEDCKWVESTRKMTPSSDAVPGTTEGTNDGTEAQPG